MKVCVRTPWGKIICGENNIKWSRNANFLHIKTNAIDLTFAKEDILEVKEDV